MERGQTYFVGLSIREVIECETWKEGRWKNWALYH
jgi:hypothetical protein